MIYSLEHVQLFEERWKVHAHYPQKLQFRVKAKADQKSPLAHQDQHLLPKDS
jgi:hypothetical protein